MSIVSVMVSNHEHQKIDAFKLVLEKILKSPLDCKDIKPVNPKENQSWIFIESTVAEAPILCPLDAKTWLIGKDLDTEKDWRQREKGQQGVIIHGLTESFYMN